MVPAPPRVRFLTRRYIYCAPCFVLDRSSWHSLDEWCVFFRFNRFVSLAGYAAGLPVQAALRDEVERLTGRAKDAETAVQKLAQKQVWMYAELVLSVASR